MVRDTPDSGSRWPGGLGADGLAVAVRDPPGCRRYQLPAGLALSTPKFPELKAEDLHFPRVEEIGWRDYYASADPVPGGPLLDKYPNWLSCTLIHNRGSVLLDHSSYRRNAEEFISVIAREIADRRDGTLEPM